MDNNNVVNERKNVLKDIYYIFVPLVLYIFIRDAVSLLGKQMGLSSVITSTAGCFICILLLYPLFYVPLKRRLIENNCRVVKRIRKKSLVWVVLTGVSGCFVLNGIVSMIQLNKILSSYNSVAQVLYEGNILLVAIQMVIAAPIVEELVFRGLLYQGLKNLFSESYYKSIVAAIFSSILFGAMHGNVLQAIYAFFLGVILSVIFEKYQSLKPCILFHMFANAFSVIGTKTSLLSFVFSSWWVVMFYTIILGLLFIIGLLKIITNKCSDDI